MTATEVTEVLHGALVRMPTPGGRLSVAELKQEAEEVRELVRAVLIEGSDYGQIPGTKKPTLFKSGAETLLRRFGFGHRMDKVEIDRDAEGRHYGVTYRCTVHVIADPDMVVSTCDGYCGYDEPDREEHTNQWGKVVPRSPWNTVIKMCLAASTPIFARSERGEYLTEATRLWSWQSRLTSTPVYVPGPDGDWVRVLNVFKNGVQPIVRVRLRDGTEHRVTPNHRFLTERGLVEASDLKLSDVLVRRSIVLNDSKVTDPDFGWLVGLVMADGALSKVGVRITLGLHEESLARRAVYVMQRVGCRAQYVRRADAEAWEVRGFGPAIVGLLCQFISGTAKRKHLAASAWRGGAEFAEAIIQGWLDGDGSLSIREGRNAKWEFGFTQQSDLWARDLRTLCTIAGYQLVMRGGLSAVGGKTFRTWAGSIRVPAAHGNNMKPSQVVAIDDDGETMTYDIEVDSEDHLWVLADGTVTHNSQKRALIGATLQATATSGLFTQDMEDAGTTASATDQRDWYEQNGWTGADEESTCHTEIIAKAKELPEVAQRAFGAWYKAEGISLKRALTRAEYDALAAKLEAIANGEAPADEPASADDGSATKSEPQPEHETADDKPNPQPEPEGSTADLADKMDAALNADPDRVDPVERFKQETGLTDEYMAESNAKFVVTPAYTADVIAAVMDMDRETRVAMLGERKLPTSGNLDSLGKRLAEALVAERWQPEAGTLL